MEKETYKYAKVPYDIAKKQGIANIRKRVSDGMVVINQSDMLSLDGDTLDQKIANVEGVLLTEEQALQEIKSPYIEQNAEIPEITDLDAQEETHSDDKAEMPEDEQANDKEENNE